MPAVVGETNRKLTEGGVKTILSIQDTTEVEYKTNAKGLGNIGRSETACSHCKSNR